jgi:hypothetical protein
VVLVSSRILRYDGLHWLRTPDGWVCEECFTTDRKKLIFTPFCRLRCHTAHPTRLKRNENAELDNIKEKLSRLEHIAGELVTSVKLCKHLITEVNGRLSTIPLFHLFALFRHTSERSGTKP